MMNLEVWAEISEDKNVTVCAVHPQNEFNNGGEKDHMENVIEKEYTNVAIYSPRSIEKLIGRFIWEELPEYKNEIITISWADCVLGWLKMQEA